MLNEEKLLKQIFNDNRAEWSSDNFDKLFVEPTYLSKLESIRPCVLVGGRGTGKTTSLHSLKFDSTFERLKSNNQGFSEQEYFGILVRMNKNRVKAFQGSQFSNEKWQKLFAHYFNLLVCKEFVELAKWLEIKCDKTISKNAVEDISIDLALEKAETLDDLYRKIKINISKLQIYVNNGDGEEHVPLSIAESPLKTFALCLKDEGLISNKVIFCCIDEYENLSNDQQAVINTYIKHAERPLSFKVGVRKNGLRNRQTLDGHDLLKVPDDYAEIEIADEGFDYFANAVGELRLKFLKSKGLKIPTTLNEFLEELTFNQEAEELGAKKVVDSVLDELKKSSIDVYDFFKDKPSGSIFFIKYWLEKNKNSNLLELAVDWINNPERWEDRINNHGYASLFWLSKGQKGLRIKKYYCGKRVILALAGGNIRYFLELIDYAINIQYSNNSFSNDEMIVLSAASQTLSAREVGKRRLNQLEELADNGVQLKRLVLAIGKVFFEFARNPEDKSPETNSFVLTGNEQDRSKLIQLLMEGVGHLAFEAEPRTKATSANELRDDEYRLHRIFTGFFEISHRKKRRTTFDAAELLKVLDDKPTKAISNLLACNRKELVNTAKIQSAIEELPEQLAFFSSFYTDGGDE